MNDNKNILLFDGECNLCNNLVIFIIKKDSAAKFKFAPLQSTIGKSLLKNFPDPLEKSDSVVFINGGIYYFKSTAILEIFKTLGRYWNLFYVFILIPKFFRDACYDLVAKSRYKVFGKRETCMVPTPEINKRFLS